MIVVLGRPRVQRIGPDGPLVPGGLAAEVALWLGRGGTQVELVGSIGDDTEGDRVVVELGRAGVGHAALLRDPARRTPQTNSGQDERPLPRLEAADVELGLRYLADCRVLVVAEPLEETALAQALAAAAYHGAVVVLVAPAGHIDPARLGERVTLLERPVASETERVTEEEPEGEAGPEPHDETAFAGLVAAYALHLDRGVAPESALAAALDQGAWEPSPD